MAAKTKGSTQSLAGRRDVLRLGAVAAGAALLPGTGGAASTPPALDVLRADYFRRLVEPVTAHFRARFLSGDLTPWGPNDDRWGDMIAAEDGGLDLAVPAPNDVVAEECYERVGEGDAAAALVMAVSPSTAGVLDANRGRFEEPDAYRLASLRWGAAEVLAADVFALARSRGWLPAEVRS